MMNFQNQTSSNRIRSFIRRQGRITPGQQFALECLWPKYCLDPKSPFDFDQIFPHKAPVILEIGFGNGESLLEMASTNPEKNYIGIEVHRPGVGHLLLGLEKSGINNVRIICHDAIDILERNIADDSLMAIHLFFPDPWPKKRHHKRRIVRPDFVDLIVKKLHSGGYLHVATDWQNYAQSILATVSQCTELENLSPDNSYCQRPDDRPLTKFEQRGILLGHEVWDIIFAKKDGSISEKMKSL